MLNVLLVDDEKTLLEATSVYLKRRENIETDFCFSPEEARFKLKKQKFDAIISDYDMPEENGIEFLKSLREQNDTIPFILFTGKSREEIAIAALNNGADYYIQKGGDVKTIFSELAMMIRKSVERDRSIKKIDHLNKIFYTLKEVKNVISNSKNLNSMLKLICSTILNSKGYNNVRIVLFDSPGNITASGQSGFGDEFNKILEWLKKGELTGCAKSALATRKLFYSEKCSKSCNDCPLKTIHEDKGAITTCLEYENKLYGIISVTIPTELVSDPDEHSLFEEIAKDISGAIYNYELKKDKIYRKSLKTTGNKLNKLNNSIFEEIYNQTRIISENISLASNNLSKDTVLYLNSAASANEIIRSEILFARDYQNLGLYEPLWQNVSDVFIKKTKIFFNKNIEYEINTNDLEIFADPMLEKIFGNLIDNSIKHGKNVTKIRLSSYEDDNNCYMSMPV